MKVWWVVDVKFIEVLENNQFLELEDRLYPREGKSLAVTMGHGDLQAQLGNANRFIVELEMALEQGLESVTLRID
jgi:hypothetical protein